MLLRLMCPIRRCLRSAEAVCMATPQVVTPRSRELSTQCPIFTSMEHNLLPVEACYDRGTTFRLKCFLNDGAP